MFRLIFKFVLKFFYRVEVKGLDNYHKAGNRVLIVANHLSFLDALLLAIFLPEKSLFAVNTYIAQKWWMKPFLLLVDYYAMDPVNPMATKSLINEIKKDKKCVIFPEGRITVTGSLMKIYEGPGMIADKSGAVLLPIRIEGAQYSPLSRLKGKVRIRLFPKIILRIQEPVEFYVDENIVGRDRRQANGQKLYDIMTDMLFKSADYKKNLFESLIDASQIHGLGHKIALDVARKEVSYRGLMAKSFIVGREIAKETQVGEYVGFMLPNMILGVVTFFAMQAFGRVPAMLNYSAGALNLVSACKTAQIKTVYSSKMFVQKAKLEEVVGLIEKEGVRLIYLEDLAKKIGFLNKIHGLLRSCSAMCYFKKINQAKPTDIAVILFTSGSEGVPKGVALSHENIQANRCQLASRVDFSSQDVVFNALPIFHSFGLTAGTILPILSGIKTFFYPSPLHYRIIPELIYDIGATIMFGTNTFLSNYARFAHSYDFYSLRYVFAGAEKLDDEVRKTWIEKFGVRIFEGYGATETSPVLATNTPMHNNSGSVGRLMPGIESKFEDVPGINDGKRLMVKGANIMMGYLLSDNPGKIQPLKDGWYDTGDIVAVDDLGYITIKGRAKRFAKVGGEMVSLTAVEGYLSKFFPEFSHAITALPDAKKGEQLALLTTKKDMVRQNILENFRKEGIAELSIPKEISYIDQIPLLGTGKVDYVAVKKIFEKD